MARTRHEIPAMCETSRTYRPPAPAPADIRSPTASTGSAFCRAVSSIPLVQNIRQVTRSIGAKALDLNSATVVFRDRGCDNGKPVRELLKSMLFSVHVRKSVSRDCWRKCERVSSLLAAQHVG